MNVEIPIFEGSTEERLAALERFVISFAEGLNSRDCCISSISRGREREGADELTVTYTDGRRARYLITRIQ